MTSTIVVKRIAIVLAAALVVAACSGGSGASASAWPSEAGVAALPDADGGADGPGPAEDGAAPAGTSADGSLKIISLSTTAATLVGGNPEPADASEITFVAIVTDTKGLETIAGGQLVDASGATYAAFGAGANKSTYTASVTWERVNQTSPINVPKAGAARIFQARFFDNVGNMASASASVMLRCRGEEGLTGACSGVCLPPREDGAHCGCPPVACAKGRICAGSTCVAIAGTPSASACVIPYMLGAETTCGDLCSTAGCDGAFSFTNATCAPPGSFSSAGLSNACGRDLSKAQVPSMRCVCK